MEADEELPVFTFKQGVKYAVRLCHLVTCIVSITLGVFDVIFSYTKEIDELKTL